MANSVIQLPKAEDAVAEPPLPPAPLRSAIAPIIAVSAPAPDAARWEPPVLGSLAVIFGVASLFTGTLALAPLGLAFAAAAGVFRQIPWAVIGAASAVVGLATSKYFWALLGLAWLLDWLL